jgi:hypothetical protein
VEDCLQHDFEGKYFLLYIINWMIKIEYIKYLYNFLGCRRVKRSDDGIDVCRFYIDGYSRPENKSTAMEDGMIGGTVVGSAGAVGTTQIGVGDYFYIY